MVVIASRVWWKDVNSSGLIKGDSSINVIFLLERKWFVWLCVLDSQPQWFHQMSKFPLFVQRNWPLISSM